MKKKIMELRDFATKRQENVNVKRDYVSMVWNVWVRVLQSHDQCITILGFKVKWGGNKRAS